MKIKPFAVEEWMYAWEVGAKYNIAETCVDSISMNELFELTGEDKTEFLNRLCARRLSYGDIEGLPEFRKGVCGLYKTLNIENIVPTHGASGANHHVFYSLISPGDRVVSIMPTYQQLYSIPESYGADVQILQPGQAAQGGQVGDLVLEQLQVFQLRQGGQGRDVGDGVAGEDKHLQVGQVVKEGQVVHLVVADVQGL